MGGEQLLSKLLELKQSAGFWLAVVPLILLAVQLLRRMTASDGMKRARSAARLSSPLARTATPASTVVPSITTTPVAAKPESKQAKPNLDRSRGEMELLDRLVFRPGNEAQFVITAVQE